MRVPEPPFDVAIHVEGLGRGVYKLRPLAGGIVDGPNGPIEVQLGIDEPIDENAPAQPMRFSIMVGERTLVIDVTDMLERVARELLRPNDRPPRTLQFRKRGKSSGT